MILYCCLIRILFYVLKNRNGEPIFILVFSRIKSKYFCIIESIVYTIHQQLTMQEISYKDLVPNTKYYIQHPLKIYYHPRDGKKKGMENKKEFSYKTVSTV